MKEAENLFLDYYEKGRNMDALYALDLLIKAYMKECNYILGMRTAIYSAAEAWLYDRLPKQDNNPFSNKELHGTLAALMPRLCDTYKADHYGKYEICGGIPVDVFVDLCKLAINEKMYDEDTLVAFSWATRRIPHLYAKWAMNGIHRDAFMRPFLHGGLNPNFSL